MEKQKRGFGFLIFVLLVVVAILGFYFLAADKIRSDVFLAIRAINDRILPRLIDSLTSPLNSIGASIKEFFSGINIR